MINITYKKMLYEPCSVFYVQQIYLYIVNLFLASLPPKTAYKEQLVISTTIAVYMCFHHTVT